MQGAQLRKHIDATLGSGNLREAVKLPTGEDLNEWLAVNSNSLSLQVAVQCLWYFLYCIIILYLTTSLVCLSASLLY